MDGMPLAYALRLTAWHKPETIIPVFKLIIQMETAYLNRTSRILAGHLWVFSNELAVSPKKFKPGSLVELRDRKENFLGIGYINPASLIAIRILTREREEIDEGFFKKRINDAMSLRRRLIDEKTRDAFRALYSESDLVPGLIVDKYSGVVSIQLLTLGIETFRDTIIKTVDEVLSPEAIVLRNDSSARTLEGLPLGKELVKGSLEKLPVINEGGIRLEVDPLGGQKTGFFLDQAENRMAFSALTGKGTALDLFSYSGAWALHMAGKGADVTIVDSSAAALKQAERNFEINGLKGRSAFIKEDVFDFLKAEAGKGRSYDYIALDPPAFVKGRSNLKAGARAYREINTLAMRLLKKGGLLATSSCSFHVKREDFLDILRSASRDAGSAMRIIETRPQAKDHPVYLPMPETEYLKCVILERF